MSDTCPRCEGSFRCGVAGPHPCACFDLTLPPGLFAQLRERYDRCLCLDCLRELCAGADPSSPTGPRAPGATGLEAAAPDPRPAPAGPWP